MMKTIIAVSLITLLFFGCKQTDSKKNSFFSKASFSAATACMLSQISYCDNQQDSLHKYLPKWSIVWKPQAINGNDAYVATDGTNYAVAMRGSLIKFSWNAFDNWIYQNLNVAVQKSWEFTDSSIAAKVSLGAYSGWQNINKLTDSSNGKTLWQFLDSVTTLNTPIYITGHSLGGNLATIYSSWLYTNFKKAEHPHDNINVITFAAPAVGNKLFAEDFNKKFPQAMRFENTQDIVPKFPVAEAVTDLKNLYKPMPAATEITVGYKILAIKLSTFLSTLPLAMKALETTNGNSVYTQTNGAGNPITIPLTSKNNTNTMEAWFAEAAHQHSIVQYAKAIGAEVIGETAKN
jgi:hypothetical protein